MHARVSGAISPIISNRLNGPDHSSAPKYIVSVIEGISLSSFQKPLKNSSLPGCFGEAAGLRCSCGLFKRRGRGRVAGLCYSFWRECICVLYNKTARKAKALGAGEFRHPLGTTIFMCPEKFTVHTSRRSVGDLLTPDTDSSLMYLYFQNAYYMDGFLKVHSKLHHLK